MGLRGNSVAWRKRFFEPPRATDFILVFGVRLVCAADIVVLFVGKYASWVYASFAGFCT